MREQMTAKRTLSIYLRIPGNQVLRVTFCVLLLVFVQCLIVVSDRRASACLKMLSAKQDIHWYHF